MKKIIALILCLATVFSFAGCSNGRTKTNLEGDLGEILTSIYSNTEIYKEPAYPFVQTPISEDNCGTNLDMTYEKLSESVDEAVESVSSIGALTHSMILYKLNDKVDVDMFVADLSKALKNDRFGCLKAKNSSVIASGNYVLSIVDHGETCEEIITAFQKLAGEYTESVDVEYEISGGMLKP